MKKTKEWISDYLRYFLLILAIILLVFLIVITLKVYQRYDRNTAGDNIEILSETGTEQTTEKPVEKMSETESETETEAVAETESETKRETETESETVPQPDVTADGGTSALAENGTSDDGQGTDVQAQPEENPSQEDGQATDDTWSESTGDYRTIVSTCNLRSYPDYGDNVIGECYTGQTVEFLGEEAGWYKVSVDGTVGYIGPKFLG